MADFQELVDLASEKLGGTVLFANDDFFAEKENLLRPKKAVFLEHEYTDRGKWMDGWESRRKRGPGHDFAIVRLGLPGIVRGVVVDTSFFRGNYPDACSISWTYAPAETPIDVLLSDATVWRPLLPQSKLAGDSANLFPVNVPDAVTHLRLDIFPDGGVARLRVHGDVVPDWRRIGTPGSEFDLAALENGGESLVVSDMFFGVRHNLLMPGRAINMSDGWETKRRRGPGKDWNVVRLVDRGFVQRVEVDTNHFKGNYPDTFELEGADLPADAPRGSAFDPEKVTWTRILPRTKLQAHTRHFFRDAIEDAGPFTHVRLTIHPDGGVSRLRVHGTLAPEARARQALLSLARMTPAEAEATFLRTCGSRAWAKAMTAKRPFASPEALFEAAATTWKAASKDDVREAFGAHPRIGEKKADRTQGAVAAAWSSAEQAAASAATEASKAALADGNRRYEAKFGHIFLVCATGKTADEMLALLEARLANDAAKEMDVAAAEQGKITRLRLERFLLA
ncbi:MAG: allantoicase [Polyangiaceae bacterium]